MLSRISNGRLVIIMECPPGYIDVSSQFGELFIRPRISFDDMVEGYIRRKLGATAFTGSESDLMIRALAYVVADEIKYNKAIKNFNE